MRNVTTTTVTQETDVAEPVSLKETSQVPVAPVAMEQSLLVKNVTTTTMCPVTDATQAVAER